MSAWWNQPRSLLKPWDSMSFGWSGTGREKATGAKNRAEGATVVASGVRLTTRIMKRHRLQCDEGTHLVQTLERFRHEVWMGKKSQTDEDASRQVKLSEKGEHKIEGDATNKGRCYRRALDGAEYDPSTSTRER